MMQHQHLIACRECDLLNVTKPYSPEDISRCSRCGSLLHSSKINSIDRTLALVIAGLMFFLIACCYPLLNLKVVGAETTNKMITGVIDLYHYGLKDCSLMVFMMTIIVPFIKLAMLLYILLSLKLNINVPGRLFIFRMYHTLDVWGMLDVYMLAIIVAMVKLVDFATVSTGIGLYAFIVLIVISLSASATLDHHLIWEKLEESR